MGAMQCTCVTFSPSFNPVVRWTNQGERTKIITAMISAWYSREIHFSTAHDNPYSCPWTLLRWPQGLTHHLLFLPPSFCHPILLLELSRKLRLKCIQLKRPIKTAVGILWDLRMIRVNHMAGCSENEIKNQVSGNFFFPPLPFPLLSPPSPMI